MWAELIGVVGGEWLLPRRRVARRQSSKHCGTPCSKETNPAIAGSALSARTFGLGHLYSADFDDIDDIDFDSSSALSLSSSFSGSFSAASLAFP